MRPPLGGEESVEHSNSLMAMAQTAGIPPYSDLLWPTLVAIRNLGGAGKLEEIDDAVIEDEGFSEEQMSVLHKDGPRSGDRVPIGLGADVPTRHGDPCQPVSRGFGP